MKKKLLITIAIILQVVLLSACTLMESQVHIEDSLESATQESNESNYSEKESDVSIIETTEAAQPSAVYPEAYTEVLLKYQRAHFEGWDRIMCVENGISCQTPIEHEYDGLYYALSDLNDDGIDELVIAEYPYREDTDTNFIDIYTIVYGEVVHVKTNDSVFPESLCDGGLIKHIGAEQGDYNSYVSFWKLRDLGFEKELAVYEIDGQWYSEGYRGVGSKITHEEAEKIIANYHPARMDFTEIPSVKVINSLTGYESFDYIINKYITALTENWTWEQLAQNDISPNIQLDDNIIRNNLGWCLMDIDKNGIEELVISDGVHLLDLFVIQPHNRGLSHLLSAYPDDYQLCENGIIRCTEYYSGRCTWRWLQLSDIGYVQQDIVSYDGQLDQYYYGVNGENLKPISKDESDDLINRYQPAELTLTPFVESEFFAPNEMGYYRPLIELYQTALNEEWYPSTCQKNGLSLMVAYHGEYYDNLGYAMIDLDGNGIDELIITDGRNIYDLFTLIQDEITSPLHLASAKERIEYFLTTDGWIYCRGSGGASVSYHTLYSMGEQELVLIEGFMFDANTDPQNPGWFCYDGIEQGEACSNAAAAIDSYVLADIPFTPFQ